MFLTFDSATTVHINITCVSYLTQSAVPVEGKSVLSKLALCCSRQKWQLIHDRM